MSKGMKKLSSRFEEKNKSSPGKQKLSVFSPLDVFITVKENSSGISTRTLDGKWRNKEQQQK